MRHAASSLARGAICAFDGNYWLLWDARSLTCIPITGNTVQRTRADFVLGQGDFVGAPFKDSRWAVRAERQCNMQAHELTVIGALTKPALDRLEQQWRRVAETMAVEDRYRAGAHSDERCVRL